MNLTKKQQGELAREFNVSGDYVREIFDHMQESRKEVEHQTALAEDAMNELDEHSEHDEELFFEIAGLFDFEEDGDDGDSTDDDDE